MTPRTLLLIALGLTALMPDRPAVAQEPFVGEIRWVAFNFPPRGWARCDGQILPIVGNEALFSLLGTTYGGNGRTDFALPDMRGRVQVHMGSGPGLTTRQIGSKGGTETHTLTRTEMPGHKHKAKASGATADSRVADDRVLAATGQHRHWPDSEKRRPTIYAAGPANVAMDESAITTTGGGQPHENMQPYLTVNCVIALTGIFPSRN